MAKKNISELIKENSEKDVNSMKQVQEPEPKETKAVISAMAPESMIKALDARATLTGKTRSDLILEACSAYIKANPVNEDMVKAFLAMANAE